MDNTKLLLSYGFPDVTMCDKVGILCKGMDGLNWMQEQMTEITAELEATEYSATSGGDMVKATVTGKMEVKSIEIKPEIIDPDDAEMLSDLVMAAVNEALRAAENDKNERMGAISGGLNLPGMF